MAGSPPEDPFAYPARVFVKALGEASGDFEGLVVETVQRHVGELEPDAVSSRPSREGRYLAVTVRITAESREQLDALYRELSQDSRIRVVL